ncbi:hypothetical protein AF70_00039820 [Pseudomonas sp. KD5]|nr:hypothetical protein [Pseudomonas sp. KD5]
MTPGAIFTELKKELGGVNPYMAIVDSSVRIFLDDAKTHVSPSKFMAEKAKLLGYGRLYLDQLELERAKQFVYISHVAFINSKAEVACEKIRKQPLVRKPVSAVEGDYLRQAIRVIHASRNGSSTIMNDDLAMGELVGIGDVAIIDYYRKLRNENFHGSKVNTAYPFDQTQISHIVSRYGVAPSQSGSLNSQDMILLSKVWQQVIFDLCVKSLHPENDVLPVVAKRYKGITGDRRAKGITQHLQQEYLLDSYSAHELFLKM